MMTPSTHQIEEIPIETITILNPRGRDAVKFQQLVESIKNVGLKRPIKVSPRRSSSKAAQQKYNLICGQGRLEAFERLGEPHIPAIIVPLTKEECLLQSLMENIARRSPLSIEFVHSIASLVERGYSYTEIADKTGLRRDHVGEFVNLIKNGEERLLVAVERGRIPVSVAGRIAAAKDEDAQAALQEAYERHEIKGHKLQTAVRIVNERNRGGKHLRKRSSTKRSKFTARTVMKAFQEETERQRRMVRKANLTEMRLSIIKGALSDLLADENFVTLLRAEGLQTMPKKLADFIRAQGAAA